MLFSQRNGYKKIKDIIQFESIDNETRNRLWNALSDNYWSYVERDWITIDSNGRDGHMYYLCSNIWHNYFKLPLDEMGNKWRLIYNELRKYFFACQWNEVYDFIEFVPQTYMYSYGTNNESFISQCNTIFEQENCGYRFVNGKITSITTPIEIAEIETAINNSLKAVTVHLNMALTKMSDRKNPDYRNSIKESISAVESMCKLISNNPKATLSEALKELEKGKKVSLHNALKKAFENIYGYTNDADGIRHALLEDSTLKYEDAKFMLVSCSAFINYLKVKAEEARIKIQ